MADISLTASMRSNLLSLQGTQKLMDMTQERLSTGKKVNSAIDNPTSYYTARSLNNRAGDLNALLDSMGQGIQTIKAANEGIESITAFVEQAKSLINTALDTAASSDTAAVTSTGTFKDDPGTVDTADLTFNIDGKEEKISVDIVDSASDAQTIDQLATNITAKLGNLKTKPGGDTFTADVKDGQIVIKNSNKEVTWSVSGKINGLDISGKSSATQPNVRTTSMNQYNEVLSQIDQLAKDSGYKGVNLLQTQDLTVNFNEDRSSNLVVKGVEADTEGLKLVAGADWDKADNASLTTAMESVEGAINTLRGWASEFGNNFAILQNREDFTDKLINVLTEGGDKLTLADMNEESANMLALQTRQQLAINSLSLASQAAQSVLKLF